MYHYRKTRKHYVKHLSPPGCPFCDKEIETRTIRETEHLRIVPNLTSYDVWELTKVVDHLLILPKRHVATLQELTKTERTELIDLMAEYEVNGYSIHARAPQSTTRSVTHQHTHLIKTEGKRARASLFLKKPYVLLRIK